MRIELFKNNSNSNIVVEEFYDYDDTLVINAGMNTTVLSNKSRVQSSICTSHSRNRGSRLSMATDMAAAVVTSRERTFSFLSPSRARLSDKTLRVNSRPGFGIWKLESKQASGNTILMRE